MQQDTPDQHIFDEARYISVLREVRHFTHAEITRAVVYTHLNLPHDESLTDEQVSNRHKILLSGMGYRYREYPYKQKGSLYKDIPLFKNQPFKNRYQPDLDGVPSSADLNIDSFLGRYVVQLLHQLGFDRFFYDVLVAANTQPHVINVVRKLAPSPNPSDASLSLSPPWYHLPLSFVPEPLPSSGRLVFNPDDDRAYLFIQHSAASSLPRLLDLAALQNQAQIIIIHEVVHFYLYHFIFKRLTHCQHLSFELAGPLVDSLALSCLNESFATMLTADICGPTYVDYFTPAHTPYASVLPLDFLARLPCFWAQRSVWVKRKREAWEKLFIFKHYLPWVASCWALEDRDRATRILVSPAFPPDFRMLAESLEEPLLDLYHTASLTSSTFLAVIKEIETNGPMNIIYDAYTFNEFVARNLMRHQQ